MHELAVELLDELGMLEHHLRHVSAGLEIAAALELEEIALGADHRALGQALKQARPLGGPSRRLARRSHRVFPFAFFLRHLKAISNRMETSVSSPPRKR